MLVIWEDRKETFFFLAISGKATLLCELAKHVTPGRNMY
jgi:hypothetical protein